MGVSLANVQVCTDQQSAAEMQAVISEAIRQRLRADGFVPLTDDDGVEAPDRMVFLAIAASGRWVTVYDEQIEFGTERVLCDWTAALSAAARGFALGVSVEDSDAARLFLFRDGAPVDAFVSDPEDAALEDRIGRWFDRYSGRPERWQDLLIEGVTLAQLRAAWDVRPVFAEEIFTAVAPLFGLDERLWRLSWQDAVGAWRSTGQRQGGNSSSRFIRLAFRAVTPSVDRAEAQGPPLLSIVDGSDYQLRAVVGDPLPQLHVLLANTGGASRGLRLQVWGSALDQGLVELTTVRAVVGPSLVNRPPIAHEAGLVPARQGATVMRAATLPTVVIPAGLAEERPRPSLYREQEIGRSSQILLTVSGTVVAPGQGELWLTVVHRAEDSGERSIDFPVSLIITLPPDAST